MRARVCLWLLCRFAVRTCFASTLAYALLVDGFNFPAFGSSRVTFSQSLRNEAANSAALMAEAKSGGGAEGGEGDGLGRADHPVKADWTRAHRLQKLPRSEA